jgi:hypothetical protein
MVTSPLSRVLDKRWNQRFWTLAVSLLSFGSCQAGRIPGTSWTVAGAGILTEEMPTSNHQTPGRIRSALRIHHGESKPVRADDVYVPEVAPGGTPLAFAARVASHAGGRPIWSADSGVAIAGSARMAVTPDIRRSIDGEGP